MTKDNQDPWQEFHDAVRGLRDAVYAERWSLAVYVGVVWLVLVALALVGVGR